MNAKKIFGLTVAAAGAGAVGLGGHASADDASFRDKSVSEAKSVQEEAQKTPTYTVQSGDTLTAISQVTGVSVEDLTAFNGLQGQNFIITGDQLKLTDGTTAPATTTTAAAATTATTTTTQAPATQTPAATATSSNAAANLALQYASMSIPYVYGGTTTAGFDCSGLTSAVYKSALGIDLPRTAAAQAAAMKQISVAEAQPGDLLFWGTGAGVFHTAIYIGDGQIVAATLPGRNISVESLASFPATFAGTLR
ncbi:MAG: LysM peptidoglycan-binding domain-containing C40 family peptidase [Lactobacillaceae bacterium]|jgi:cell wall-associated NlpC family hydrolase|nr:LysM peptidoglycan-binding domain-containing C40 family peptidase [Lactobacillaceae bacterium]